jgi:hypothetical protein
VAKEEIAIERCPYCQERGLVVVQGETRNWCIACRRAVDVEEVEERYEIIAGAWRGKVGVPIRPWLTRDFLGQLLHLEIEEDGVEVGVAVRLNEVRKIHGSGVSG